MCHPAAIYAVAALQAYNSYEQGRYARDVGRYNERLLQNEAIRTRNKGTAEEMKQRERTAQLISKQKVAAAASGVEVGGGSAAKLREDTALLGEVDALQIRSNFQDKARSLEYQAYLAERQGEHAYRAGIKQGIAQAGATIIGSGVAQSWYTPASAASTGTMSGSASIGAIA